jgi:hypothetical protein
VLPRHAGSIKTASPGGGFFWTVACRVLGLRTVLRHIPHCGEFAVAAASSVRKWLAGCFPEAYLSEVKFEQS